ncbi:MFS transporter [Neobacillus drentensis]|uniref:MFS transporter n=1 Tax=Neobacillus drentensis TaxID=220684 RepID=UPI002FFDDB0D
MLGTFSFTFISSLTTDAQFLAWGWRVPFLFSAVLIALALWIRNGIEETPAFKQQKESGELAKIPVVETFRHYWKNVFHLIGMKLGDGMFNVFSMSFILVYATTHLGYSRETALTAVTIGCATMIISIPLVGYLSDFIGRKIIYISSLVAFLIIAIPYFTIIPKGTVPFYFMQVIVLGIVWGAIFSTQGTIFSELFPAKVRYTGLSFGYQVSAALAGFGPMIWTPMLDKFGPSPMAFGGLMMAGCALSLILSFFVPDTRKMSKYDDSIIPIENKKISI